MSLSSHAEIRVKQNELFTAPFNGVFISDKAYREFILIDEQYEVTKIDLFFAKSELERYKENLCGACGFFKNYWTYALLGGVIGFIAGGAVHGIR